MVGVGMLLYVGNFELNKIYHYINISLYVT